MKRKRFTKENAPWLFNSKPPNNFHTPRERMTADLIEDAIYRTTRVKAEVIIFPNFYQINTKNKPSPTFRKKVAKILKARQGKISELMDEWMSYYHITRK